MAAVGNFQEKLTEENKAEFVAKLDNIVTDFALKVPVEKGGSTLFSSLKVFLFQNCFKFFCLFQS